MNRQRSKPRFPVLSEWRDNMAGTSWRMRLYYTRLARCHAGVHWPIKWDESAYPGSYDPPEPPEAWWACQTCGKAIYEGPHRRWMWWLRSWVTHPLFMWREVWPARVRRG